MNKAIFSATLAACTLLAACGGNDGASAGDSAATAEDMTDTAPPAMTEIEPGLSMRILKPGSGAVAKVGQTAVVHYTGWLYDETAADHHGKKFDSSRDRNQHFQFPLGAGEVIKGWDRGVVGMQVGELRELTIAPELAYGAGGFGEVIPPASTLVFEVELAELEGEASPPATEKPVEP